MGALEPLATVVAARWRGEKPTAAQLRVCEQRRYKGDLACFNGKRPDRPHCGWAGSQNWVYYAACGLGDYGWVADVSRLEAAEGNFGRENGSLSEFYCGGVIGCKMLAQRELERAGRLDDAEAVRLAIRSNVAWFVLTTLPTPRLRDTFIEAGKERVAIAKAGTTNRLTAAVSGNRQTVKQRGGLTTQDSPSEVVTRELASVDPLGLTKDEVFLCKAAIDGDVAAARIVASWMFGTIDTPNTRWKWRLRRTTEGAESVFLGPNPSSYKPAITVAQITNNGAWRGMKPSPQGKQNKWGSGEYAVEIEGGVIHARCGTGEAAIPELGGEVLWQVDVEGCELRFNGEAVRLAA